MVFSEIRSHMKKKSKSKVYLKIFGFFCILIIPTLILGIVTYQSSKGRTEKELVSKTSANLGSAIDMIDSRITTAKELSLNFLMENMVVDILKPYDKLTTSDKTKLNQISLMLRRYNALVLDFVDNIYIYIDNEKVYNSEGSEDYNLFFDKTYHYENYNALYWQQVLQKNDGMQLMPVSEVTRNKGGKPIQVLPIVMSRNVGAYPAIAVINIDVTSLQSVLSGNSVFESTEFIVLDSNNQTVLDSGRLLGYIDIDELKYGNAESNGASNIKINGKSYMVVQMASAMHESIFYSLTPAYEFSSYTSGILMLTISLCLLMVVIGLIASVIFSKNLYRPIKKLRDFVCENYESQDKIGKVINDYDTIQRGFDSLAGSINTYRSKLGNYENKLVKNSLRSLIHGGLTIDQDTLLDVLHSNGFSNSCYVCCVFFMEFKEGFAKTLGSDGSIHIFGSVMEVLSACFDKELPAFILPSENNVFICLAEAGVKDSRDKLNSVLNMIKPIFAKDLEYCQIAMGIGTTFDNIGDISNSYDAAMTALSQKQSINKLEILYSKDLNITHKYYYNFLDEQKVINCLSVSDIESLDLVIDKIIKSNKELGVSYLNQKKLIYNIFSTGVRYISEKGLSSESFTDSEFESMNFEGNENLSIECVYQQVLTFLNNIVKSEDNMSNKHQNSNLAADIIKYIDANYNNDLYLDKLADEMGVSAKYVSKIFKDKVGINITHYIHMLRIDQAKELLTGTHLTISEIMTKVGIQNRTTFLRVFKKIEGISPNKYRSKSKSNIDPSLSIQEST